MDGESTELERLLLSSVALERPGRKLHQRMRAGIGLAGSLATLKAAAAALSVAAVVTGVAVALVERGAAESNGVPREVPAVPARPTPPAEVNGVAGPSEGDAPTSEDPAWLQEDPAEKAPAEVAIAEPAARTVGSRAVQRAPAPAAPSDLRDQMRLLDRARTALRAGEPRRALSELARYSERYPRGAFGQEATVLRVEALKQSGQDSRASALARDFIEHHGDSPHVERVSDIAGSAKPSR